MRKVFKNFSITSIILIVSIIIAGCSMSNGQTPTNTQMTSGTAVTVQTTSLVTQVTESAPTAKTSVTTSNESEPVSTSTDATTTKSTPETTPAKTTIKTVTISVSCQIASERGLPGAPEDGWIITERRVEIGDEDTVFDVLKSVCDEADILLMTRRVGNAVFVSAIAGITAVDAKSGWMFSVNGEFPMISSSLYVLNDGDVIKWQYTMDSGNDL